MGKIGDVGPALRTDNMTTKDSIYAGHIAGSRYGRTIHHLQRERFLHKLYQILPIILSKINIEVTAQYQGHLTPLKFIICK